MKRRILMIATMIPLVVGVMAQKIDLRLTQLVEQSKTRGAQGINVLDTAEIKNDFNVTFRTDGTVDRLTVIATMKQGATLPTEKLEQMGIKVKMAVSNMAVLNVPADRLMLLEQVEEFVYVEADRMMEMNNDLARQMTLVDNVSTLDAAQKEGLTQAYTGAGVIVGVIDRGIDFNHEAFRNADGTTRIKKAIVYDHDDKTDFTTEAEIKTLTSDATTSSHGSHTAATAAGSRTLAGVPGIAPEADLVLVGLGPTSPSTNIAQGVRDIFAYAEKVGKPAVINISFGNIVGLHEGGELVATTVAEETENGTKKGRAVMISSSNSGSQPESISKTLHTGEVLKTVLGASTIPTKRYPNRDIGYKIDFFAYAVDYEDFDMELKVVNLTNGEIQDVGDHLRYRDNDIYRPTLLKQTVATAKGISAVTYALYCTKKHMDDPNLRLMIIAKPGKDGQTLRIMRGGRNAEPELDAPTDKGYNFAENGYTKGNGEFAFNRMICNDAVISVGSYVSRKEWNDYLGNPHAIRQSRVTGKEKEIGEISDFSSYVVGDDNDKPRPTLIAPGQRLISAANNYDTENFEKTTPGTLKTNPDTQPVMKVDNSGRLNWYVAYQGTSMATPVVTGTVALWMQADPTLNVNRIKDIMKETCDNDKWTTDVTLIPSGHKEQAGFGKVNCLKGLKKVMETTAIGNITIDDRHETTPSAINSVNEPVYNMMGQRVDKSKKGLVIYKGRKYVNR